jgi:hypothetical protein
VTDLNGGIFPSGLFWTVDVAPHEVSFSDNGRRASLKVKDLAVIDTFQFGGASVVPAVTSFEVTWEAKGPFTAAGRGKNNTVPTDHDAFLGRFAEARSEFSCTASELGFSFRASGKADASNPKGGWAHIGQERNGSFL